MPRIHKVKSQKSENLKLIKIKFITPYLCLTDAQRKLFVHMKDT